MICKAQPEVHVKIFYYTELVFFVGLGATQGVVLHAAAGPARGRSAQPHGNITGVPSVIKPRLYHSHVMIYHGLAALLKSSLDFHLHPAIRRRAPVRVKCLVAAGGWQHAT